MNNIEEYVMNNIEQYQDRIKQQSEATMSSIGDLAKHFHAIATAHADYAKHPSKKGAAYFERLAGVKSLVEAVEVRTEYTKAAHDTFVTDSKRIAETYVELFRNAVKPFGSMIAETPFKATIK
jgi:hypothetical protein